MAREDWAVVVIKDLLTVVSDNLLELFWLANMLDEAGLGLDEDDDDEEVVDELLCFLFFLLLV